MSLVQAQIRGCFIIDNRHHPDELSRLLNQDAIYPIGFDDIQCSMDCIRCTFRGFQNEIFRLENRVKTEEKQSRGCIITSIVIAFASRKISIGCCFGYRHFILRTQKKKTNKLGK